MVYITSYFPIWAFTKSRHELMIRFFIGSQVILPERGTSRAFKGHKVYLKGLEDQGRTNLYGSLQWTLLLSAGASKRTEVRAKETGENVQLPDA